MKHALFAVFGLFVLVGCSSEKAENTLSEPTPGVDEKSISNLDASADSTIIETFTKNKISFDVPQIWTSSSEALEQSGGSAIEKIQLRDGDDANVNMLISCKELSSIYKEGLAATKYSREDIVRGVNDQDSARQNKTGAFDDRFQTIDDKIIETPAYTAYRLEQINKERIQESRNLDGNIEAFEYYERILFDVILEDEKLCSGQYIVLDKNSISINRAKMFDAMMMSLRSF